VVTRHHRGSQFEQERFYRGNLHVLKLDDPYHPIEITSFTLGSEILGLSFDEHRLLLSEGGAHGHAQASIRIMDVSTPSSPSLIHRMQINSHNRSNLPLDPQSLIKSDDYLFVSGGGKVNILNWSETDPLDFVQSLRFTGSGSLQAWHVKDPLTFEVRHDLDHSDPNNTISKSIFNVWDTTDMSKTALLASIDFNLIPRSEDPYNPFSVSNEQNGFAIQNGFAFICLGRHGISVIDVRNPQEPVLFNQIDTPGISRQILIKDSLAFVADAHGGLQIMDINDPGQMKIIGQFETGLLPVSSQFAKDEGIIMSSDEYGNHPTLDFIELTTPSKPGHSGTYRSPYPLKTFQFLNNHAFLIWNEGQDAQWVILDVSDPESVQEVSKTHLTKEVFPSDSTEIQLHPSMRFAYIAETSQERERGRFHGQIRTFDMTDLSQPKPVHNILTKGISVDGGFLLNGNYLYLNSFGSDGFTRLEIFDVGDGSVLSPVSEWIQITDKQTTEAISTGGLDVSKGFAYLGQGWHGFSIVDISDPSDPVFQASLKTKGKVSDVEAHGNFLFTAEGTNGLNVYDVSDPSSPAHIHHLPTKTPATSVHISDQSVYVLEQGGGLSVLKTLSNEVRISQQPRTIRVENGRSTTLHVGAFSWRDLSYQWYHGESGDTNRPIVDARQPAFTTPVINQAEQFWVRVSDGQTSTDSDTVVISPIPKTKVELIGTWPAEPNQLERNGFSTDVAVSGSYAYLADGLDGVRVLDITDPTHPKQINHFPSTAFQVSVHGKILFVNGHVIHQLDISHPLLPENKMTAAIDDEIILPMNEDQVILGGHGGWQSIDFHNTTNEPQISKSDVLTRAPEWAISDITRHENLAAVAQGWGGIQVLNIQQPSEPRFLSAYYPDASIKDLDWKDTWILATHGENHPGLELVNMTDPEHPIRSATTDLPHANQVVGMRGSFACVTGKGLQIFDYGDRNQLVEVGNANLSAQDTFGLDTKDQLAFVAAGMNGLFIYRITPELYMGPPTIQENQIKISWSGAPGVVLQKTFNLVTLNWQDISETDGQSEWIISPKEESAWYQVRKK
jgi:hypothetical protein